MAHRRAPRRAAHRQHSACGNGAPRDSSPAFVSPWLCAQGRGLAARALCDFAPPSARRWCEQLSRSIIDVDRDPSGSRSIAVRRRRNSSRPRPSTASLSSARVDAGCGRKGSRAAIDFDPFHGDAHRARFARLRQEARSVALFDAHSIRPIPVWRRPKCLDRIRREAGSRLTASRQCWDGRAGRLTRAIASNRGRFHGMISTRMRPASFPARRSAPLTKPAWPRRRRWRATRSAPIRERAARLATGVRRLSQRLTQSCRPIGSAA